MGRPDESAGPTSNWPGLTANPRDVRFDPTEMNKVADALQADLNQYKEVLQQLTDPTTGTDLSTRDLGDWDVARDLALAAHKAHQGTTQYLQEFLQQYQNVINAIRRSSGNYAKAEQNTTALVNQLQASPSGPPATPPATPPTPTRTSSFG
jgi:hypothetical protein